MYQIILLPVPYRTRRRRKEQKMKPYYIKDLKPDESRRIEDRFLVKTADIRDGNNGKRHLYMTLADATGDMQSVKWNLTQDEVKAFSKI